MKKLSIKDRAMAAMSNNNIPQPSSATPLPSPAPLLQKPKTGPGALVAFMDRESAVFQENQLIKEELKNWSGSTPTKKLKPSDVSASRWANRHKDSFSSPEFEQLKSEIASSGGNIQPIKVRPITGSDEQRYEIVFGHRRHRACLELGLDVLALVESITDSALFEEMDRENRQRADLRPYEQGEMYRRALDDGLYASLRKLAEAVGLQSGNVATAVKVARLPEVVLNAFPSRLDIQYRWAAPLADAIEKDPDTVIARANAIVVARKSGEVISSVETLNRLIQTSKSSTVKADRVIKVHGKAVATVSKARGRYLIEFEKGALPDEQLANLETAIAILLDKKGKGALP